LLPVVAHGAAPGNPSGWYLQWPFEPLVWAVVLVAGLLYWRASGRVAGWPVVRRFHFLGGLGIMTAALASPLAVYDGALFSVHMVQHLLITLVAAPLLALGAPVTLALRASSPGIRQRASAILRGRVVRVATNPLLSWVLFAGVIILTHFSVLYDAALEIEVVHLLEHAVLIGSAMLFWWPIVGLDPSAHRLSHPVRLVYLLLSMPVQAFVAVAIYSSGKVLYEHYETLQRSWGPEPLDDQRAAAVVMWVGGDGLVLVALVIIVLAWMRYDDRLSARADRHVSTLQNELLGTQSLRK
jgi:cytochrome c oxidase assembly factor CtaG